MKQKKLITIFIVLVVLAATVAVFYLLSKNEIEKNVMQLSNVEEKNNDYEIYFSNNNLDPQITCVKVFPTIRSTNNETVNLNLVLEELLKGPNEKEKALGYYTNIPENVKINTIKKSGNSVTVDFSKDIEKNSGGSCRVSAIRSQIYWTVIRFDKDVRSVIISVEGNTETSLQP